MEWMYEVREGVKKKGEGAIYPISNMLNRPAPLARAMRTI
jgi:hypothetical protein